MSKIITFIALIAAFSAMAEVKIQKMFKGEFVDGHHTFFLDNGKIVHAKDSDIELIKELKKAFRKELVFNYDLKVNVSTKTIEKAYDFAEISSENANSNIRKFNLIDRPDKDPMDRAHLTTFKNYDHAKSLMDTFNGATHEDSQCYNRATLWTYEARYFHGANLGRVWIFFTKKYIREYKHDWWFHVAPFAKVNDGIGRYVLDRGFTLIPYNLENWKNIFIKSKRACPVITDYRDYDKNGSDEHCYLLFSNQYFYQPYQLKKYVKKRRYNIPIYTENYLRSAYQNALIEWDGVIPGI